jgi:hypothetical protein
MLAFPEPPPVSAVMVGKRRSTVPETGKPPISELSCQRYGRMDHSREDISFFEERDGCCCRSKPPAYLRELFL